MSRPSVDAPRIVLQGGASAAAREQFLTGEPVPQASVRPEIVASWQRSVWFEVSPHKDVELPFTDHFDRGSRLMRAAAPVIDEVEMMLKDTDICVLLADSSAYIIDRRIPAGAVRSRLDANGGIPGACWRESIAGTNGLGTVLETRKPVSVVGSDHYLDILHCNGCIGVPILHPVTGRLEGILDFVCDAADATNPLRALAVKTGRDIETELMEQGHARQRVLLEHFLRACRRASHAVVAFDGDATLSNSAASTTLGPEDHAILREHTPDVRDLQGPEERRIPLSDGRMGLARLEPVVHRDRTVGVVAHVRVTAGTGTSAPSAGRTSTSQRPNPQHDATLAGSSGVWRQCVDTAAARAHAGAPLLLAGEPGTGKLALATAVLRDLGPLSVVDAALSQLDGDPPGWLAGLRSRLETPGAIVIQHVETLAPTVLALMAGVLDAAQRERQPCRVAVTATVAAGELTALSGLAARFGETVLVPRLRDHAEDVPELVRSFAAQYAPAIPPRFDPRALQAMMRADWPGNIRELESTIRGLVTGARSTEIRPEHLGPQLRARLTEMSLRNIDRAERDLIAAALREADGNKREAAARLGIARSTIYRKIAQYQLEGT